MSTSLTIGLAAVLVLSILGIVVAVEMLLGERRDRFE